MNDVINLRIPKDLKIQFHKLCRDKSSYMTTEIIRFINHYIAHENYQSHDRTYFNEKLLPSKKGETKDNTTSTWLLPEIDDHQCSNYWRGK